MAKPSKHQIELSLFYSELKTHKTSPSGQKRATDEQTSAGGLSEDQLQRLSDDLRQPYDDRPGSRQE